MTTNQTQPQIPEFVIRSRYVVEGLLLPTVGLVGIVGNNFYTQLTVRSELQPVGFRSSFSFYTGTLHSNEMRVLIINIKS